MKTTLIKKLMIVILVLSVLSACNNITEPSQASEVASSSSQEESGEFIDELPVENDEDFVPLYSFIPVPTPQLPSSVTSIEGFIPEEWSIIASLEEDLDFNNDGIEDVAYILEHDRCIPGYYDKKFENKEYVKAPRVFFAAAGQEDGSYELSVQNDGIVITAAEELQFGGDLSLSANEGTIIIQYTQGSAGTGTFTEVLKYIDTQWYLVEHELKYDQYNIVSTHEVLNYQEQFYAQYTLHYDDSIIDGGKAVTFQFPVANPPTLEEYTMMSGYTLYETLSNIVVDEVIIPDNIILDPSEVTYPTEENPNFAKAINGQYLASLFEVENTQATYLSLYNFQTKSLTVLSDNISFEDSIALTEDSVYFTTRNTYETDDKNMTDYAINCVNLNDLTITTIFSVTEERPLLSFKIVDDKIIVDTRYTTEESSPYFTILNLDGSVFASITESKDSATFTADDFIATLTQ